MLTKILIANRGEIACRIIRTAKKLGIATVAVYSDADARALHVTMADEAVHIGASPATESYLRGDRIIEVAKATRAGAVHPGYGFLAENADFADAVTKAGLKFIGPSAGAMRALGGKAAAKEIAIKANVPVVPGYQGEKQDTATLAAEAERIGYPVMIKAVAGGGGRGMRMVATEAELPELLASAQREAESSFGDKHVLIEKVVERPRHIEVQVFGDAHGNVVHLFERDCTLQRRNQKVVEEAPAPGMTPALREQMCTAAVKLARAVGYEGAGTVEFLVEGGSLGADARWYFIEMNTRLQVEHPVTEEITGLDLVEWQLRVASGETLPLAQRDISMSGHAIEVRLCAEDPANGFMPSVGKIDSIEFCVDDSSRVETGVRSGDEVSPFYDSMIAKLIAKGDDRTEALDRIVRDTGMVPVRGIRTNASFLVNLLSLQAVASGDMDTGLIGREMATLSDQRISRALLESALTRLLANRGYATGVRPKAVAERLAQPDPWRRRDDFRLGPRRPYHVNLLVEGTANKFVYEWVRNDADDGNACVKVIDAGNLAILDQDEPKDAIHDTFALGTVAVFERGRRVELSWPTYDVSDVDDGHAGDSVRAPINGKVAKVFVAEGDAVEKGQRIAVVEAMKMEHVLHAARSGTIAKVAAKEGEQVTQGALIASLAGE